MAVGAGALACGDLRALDAVPAPTAAKPDYRGPNVVVIRFGGGMRRQESIDPEHTYSLFVCRELIPRGTLFPKMEIAAIKGLETSHGEGTLNIVTGKYDQYKDIAGKFLGARFEPKVPTIFEYLRKHFAVAPHETLIVNGEDRPDEEFYTFSNHAAYGIDFRSNTLSLYRFKAWLMEQKITEGKLTATELAKRRKELDKWSRVDRRTNGIDRQGAPIEQFWDGWRRYYGETGLVNPRGDRLLTELTLRALRELRPRLLMVNYNDCDYVHWGNLNHYTRGIAIMDEGIKQIVNAVEADPEYCDNTVFVIVPDCGRDTNPAAAVPCQHHFGSRSSHEIFALCFGRGIARGAVVDQLTDQTSIAPTIGQLMGFKAEFSEGPVLAPAKIFAICLNLSKTITICFRVTK